MAILGFRSRAAWLAAVGLSLVPAPAWACSTCGCSANMCEIGSVSDQLTAGRQTGRFLLSQDVTYRAVNGTFSDTGSLHVLPTGSSLQALQATLGMTFFATSEWLVALQAPFIGNAFVGAAPSSYGSVTLRDGASQAGALGDMSLQSAYRFWNAAGPWPSLGAWVGAIAPTGSSTGTDAQITGSGVWNGQVGLTATGLSGAWSYDADVGYQRPFGTPVGLATNFYQGDSVIYQGNLGYRLTPSWKLAVGFNGYQGSTQIAGNPLTLSNLRTLASVTYSLTPDWSVRLGASVTPGYVSHNALSDVSTFCTFYQTWR
jgi:hypothetical protein